MKKLLLITICILPQIFLHASHNRSGEILYKRVPPYSTMVGTLSVAVYTYSFTVIKYTGHGNNIADRCVDTLYFGDGARGIAPRVNGTSTCNCFHNNNPVPCGELIVNDAGYVIKKNIYSITHTYPGPATYTAWSGDPARSSGILNIPFSDSQTFFIESVLVIDPPLGINASPVFSNPPTEKGSTQQAFRHQPGVFDPDKDSLSFELVPCKSALGQAIPGYSLPATNAGGTFSIDAEWGRVNYSNPSMQGEVSFAIRVKEWRRPACSKPYVFIGAVTRDMQVTVGTGTSSINFNFLPDTCIVTAYTFQKKFYTTTSAPCTMAVFGELNDVGSPPTANLTVFSGNAAFASTVVMAADCSNSRGQYSHGIVIAENLQHHKFEKQFKVKILPPAPYITSMTIDTGKAHLKWKAGYGCSGAISEFRIYRKTGANNWTHSACENGLPPISGFQMVGAVPGTDSTFTDATWPIPNGSLGHYVVTAVNKNCVESYADSVKSAILIVGINKSFKADAALNVFPNPFISDLLITSDAGFRGHTWGKLFSADGKLVYSFEKENNENVLVFNPGQIAPGLYMLIVGDEKKVSTKRVVKQ